MTQGVRRYVVYYAGPGSREDLLLMAGEFVRHHGGEILRDVDGSSPAEDPLLEAVMEANDSLATLLVVKLASRWQSEEFLQTLARADSFICADRPDVTHHTIKEMLSRARKASEKAAKRSAGNGDRLQEGRRKAMAERDAEYREVLQQFLMLGGNTYGELARCLTREGVKTPRGLDNWNASQVRSVMKRLDLRLPSC